LFFLGRVLDGKSLRSPYWHVLPAQWSLISTLSISFLSSRGSSCHGRLGPVLCSCLCLPAFPSCFLPVAQCTSGLLCSWLPAPAYPKVLWCHFFSKHP
jgi:hypothetical protein